MYQKCYSYQIGENLHNIFLWDDIDGYSQFIWKDEMGFDGMYPYQKYLIGKYGCDSNISNNHQILYFDIETELIDFKESKRDKEKEFRKRKLLSIVYYHQNTNKWCCLIVDEKNRLDDYKIDGKEIIKFKNQKSLLKYFIKSINDIGVDILVGWNSDSFDIPCLWNIWKLSEMSLSLET